MRNAKLRLAVVATAVAASVALGTPAVAATPTVTPATSHAVVNQDIFGGGGGGLFGGGGGGLFGGGGGGLFGDGGGLFGGGGSGLFGSNRQNGLLPLILSELFSRGFSDDSSRRCAIVFLLGGNFDDFLLCRIIG